MIRRCEICAATHEKTGAWNRPSGVAGAATEIVERVERADIILGYPGYLCRLHWWQQNAQQLRAARQVASIS